MKKLHIMFLSRAPIVPFNSKTYHIHVYQQLEQLLNVDKNKIDVIAIDEFSPFLNEDLVQDLKQIITTFPSTPIVLLREVSRFLFISEIEKLRAPIYHAYIRYLEPNTPSKVSVLCDNIDLAIREQLKIHAITNKLDELETTLHSQDSDKSIPDVISNIKSDIKGLGDKGLLSPAHSRKEEKDMINETLKEARAKLNVASRINLMILFAGVILLFSSFVLYNITQNLELLSFGGLGLIGVISHLITNPAKSINNAANSLVRTQIGYFSFMHQAMIIQSEEEKDIIIAKSEKLREATKELMVGLEIQKGK